MFLSGLLAPALTPIDARSAIDLDRLSAHCNWLLESCDGVVLFGTTGEATSFSAEERKHALEGVLRRGLPAGRLMVGVGTCSVTETADLGRHALESGVTDLLMLPPFYYKNLEDEGVIAHFEMVLARLGNRAPAIHLYHIPPVAGVGFSVELVGKLHQRLSQIVGLKDSSGDRTNTSALIAAYPDLAVFCGSETFLLETMRAGGAGCITATANVNAANIRTLYEGWQGPDGARLQEAATDFRARVQSMKPIPAMKALLARRRGDPAWNAVRPPFRPLPAAQCDALETNLAASAFGMPNLELRPVSA